MKQANWFTMTSITNNLNSEFLKILFKKISFWVVLEPSMFLNIPLLTIESRFLFIGLPLFSLKRLWIFGRGLFGGDGVKTVVLSFRRISPTRTGVLPFRLVGRFCLTPVWLFLGQFGPTVGQMVAAVGLLPVRGGLIFLFSNSFNFSCWAILFCSIWSFHISIRSSVTFRLFIFVRAS